MGLSGPMEPTRICFIAHPAYGEMSGGTKGEIGGIQRQLSIMARWFAARGHTVSMLTLDEGQPEEVVIDGVRIIRMYRQDEGLWGLRFVHPRWTSLIRAMRRADAQVYYQNTAECVTGQAALWCRRHGRGFVFSLANDHDVEPHAVQKHPLRHRLLYKYGLKHADLVVAQTRKQQRILRDVHGVESVVISMPSPPTGDGSPPLLPEPSRPRVVWVARIATPKRLELLLDVASLAPDIVFEVAGVANPPSAYADELVRRAETLTNVRMLGRVEREQIPELYRGALCLFNTSSNEGFPNTFIEAWSQGVPVVSTFDPDGLIAARGLGGVAADAQGLLAELRRLLASPDQWREASRRGREYYLENHLPENVMPLFEASLVGTALGKAPGGSRSPVGVPSP